MKNKKSRKVCQTQSPRCEIGDNFSFKTHHYDIVSTQRAYNYYASHKPNNLELFDSDLFIAIDTNFILDLYSMCHKEREQFLRFMEDNCNRIVITHQVEFEYTKHRNEHIRRYEKTINEIRERAKTALTGAKDAIKTARVRFTQLRCEARVKNDMPEIVELIKPIEEYISTNEVGDEYKQKLDELYATLESKLNEVIGALSPKFLSETNDRVLQALSKTIILPALPINEQEYLQKHYDELQKKFEENKSTSLIDAYRFPGVGDRGKIKQNKDPYGDFIIYHELLDFINQRQSDLVMLTTDITKSDWVKTDKSQYEQQIIDTYLHTGHMLYIYNVADVLPTIFEGMEQAGDESSEEELDGEGDEQNSPIANNTRLSYLRDITEERFLQELKEAKFWTEKYVDGYVSIPFFIYNWVGKKHFVYQSSKDMLSQLQKKGKIEVVEKKIDGKNTECLLLKE